MCIYLLAAYLYCVLTRYTQCAGFDILDHEDKQFLRTRPVKTHIPVCEKNFKNSKQFVCSRNLKIFAEMFPDLHHKIAQPGRRSASSTGML